MKTIDFSYFIERYNTGEMSSEEEQWFNKELIGNDMLRKEIDLRKITDEVLDRQDIISLRNKLSNIERKREEHTPVRKSRKSVYAKYAALIIALFLIGSITLLPKKDFNTEELNSRFYMPYEVLTPSRSASSEKETEFNLGLEYYSNGDYKTAKLHFRKVLDIEPGDIQTKFLFGVSDFNDGNYGAAEPSFEYIISDNNNHFIETAKWYLAGCFINTNEKELAINQLGIIINEEGNYYRKDAKKLLRSLK